MPEGEGQIRLCSVGNATIEPEKRDEQNYPADIYFLVL